MHRKHVICAEITLAQLIVCHPLGHWDQFRLSASNLLSPRSYCLSEVSASSCQWKNKAMKERLGRMPFLTSISQILQILLYKTWKRMYNKPCKHICLIINCRNTVCYKTIKMNIDVAQIMFTCIRCLYHICRQWDNVIDLIMCQCPSKCLHFCTAISQLPLLPLQPSGCKVSGKLAMCSHLAVISFVKVCLVLVVVLAPVKAQLQHQKRGFFQICV